MIVVDTNTLVYFWAPSERKSTIDALFVADPNWMAPLLWRSEFRNALAAHLRSGIFSLDQILLITKKAEELMLGREMDVKSVDVMRLVSESKCTAYDCEFVALALELDTLLVTQDKKVLREFRSVAVTAEDFLSARKK
ncbi:MAG: type II toxin-antitoxin system VapC family toxin [Cyclobacteriaceae bacterium]